VTAKTATIVIPTHKRTNLLRNLLESLSHQRTCFPFEVVVVNDGSGGDLGSLEVEFSDLSLKVIDLPRSRGRAYARNEGVRRSSADVLIFVDDDMTVVEEFVQQHLAAHTDPSIVVVGNVLSALEYRSHPLARYVERQGVHKLKRKDVIPAKCARTGNLSLSRALFDKIGMFDEAISMYGEDVDLGMKMASGGGKFVFVEGAISHHHHPPDIDDMMAKMKEYGKYTVPLLVASHPDVRQVIRIHLAEPVRIFQESLILSAKKIGLRIAMTPPFYCLARWVYRRQWLGSLLFPVIDYMRAYNYMRAYWAVRKGRRLC
jgi:GT2 family glycosyltransferase